MNNIVETDFKGLVDKYFPPVVSKLSETFNGKGSEAPYLHDKYLMEEYSPDLSWGTTTINNSIVAADVVALDADIPLKSRMSISTAKGDLPKLAISKVKQGKDLNTIQIMMSRGANEALIASKLLDDVPACIKGIKVRKEIMFQQALSTGVVLALDSNNNGVGVRVDFGVPEKNHLYANGRWSDTSTSEYAHQNQRDIYKDLDTLFATAAEQGNKIVRVFLSRKAFNLIRLTSNVGFSLPARDRGDFPSIAFVPGLGPTPYSPEAMLSALKDEFDAEFVVVDSTYQIERADGSVTTIRPWESANVVGVCSDKVGRLVYGSVSEELFPAEGVQYAKAGSDTLVSKYSEPKPLKMFTSAEAVVLPVIDNANAVYILHTDVTNAELLGIAPDVQSLTFTKGEKDKTRTIDVRYQGDPKKLSAMITGKHASAFKVERKGDNFVVTYTGTDYTETPGYGQSATVEITDGTRTASLNLYVRGDSN